MYFDMVAKIRKITIRKFTITIRICKNIGELKDGEKKMLSSFHIHLKLTEVFSYG